MATFDLSRPSSDVARKARGTRKIMVLLAIMTVALFLWFLILGLTPRNLHDNLQRVTFGVVESSTLALSGLFVFGIWKLGPGAIAVSVEENGIQFTWGPGRSDRLGWSDLGSGFVLLDYTENPTLPRFTQFLWEVRRWNRPATRLTREAYDAIMTAVTKRGLVYRTTLNSNSFFGWARCRVVRLVPPPSSATR